MACGASLVSFIATTSAPDIVMSSDLGLYEWTLADMMAKVNAVFSPFLPSFGCSVRPYLKRFRVQSPTTWLMGTASPSVEEFETMDVMMVVRKQKASVKDPFLFVFRLCPAVGI